MAGTLLVDALVGQGTAGQLHPQRLHRRSVDDDGLGVLHPVAILQILGDGGGIGQAQIHQAGLGVGEEGFQVVGQGVALCLPLLGHDVGDVDAQGVGLSHRLGHAIHQQVGDDAGVQAPRPQEDDVRLADGVQRSRQRRRVLRLHAHLGDAAVLGTLEGGDFGFSHHRRAVFKLRHHVHILVGHRQHLPRDGQDLAHACYRLVKGGGDTVQRRQEQVAEALPCQAPLLEPVVQQVFHDGFRVGHSLQAAADVARRGHPQVLPQHAGAAAIVGHGDDGGQVVGIVFQTPQHGGQPGAAA